MNRFWTGLVGSIVWLMFNSATTQAQSLKKSPPRILFTPLATQLFAQAKHLAPGEVTINLDTRSFFFPDLVSGAVDNEDSAVNFNTGFSWGISDDWQLTLQFQHVDSSSPIKQGDFTSERTEDNEAALELKYQLWENTAQTEALSGVLAASWGTRGFMFTRQGEETEINNRDIFVSLAIPLTADVGKRWQFNLSPTLAFFKDESAVFFHRLPEDTESSFGTVLGLGGGVSYQLNSRLLMFSELFLPLTGNNSINRNSGKPDRAIAYNAGLRFLVNSQLALDLYATNTFASYAPLSLTADRDFLGLGTNLVFMPDAIVANRQSGDRFKTTDKPTEFWTTDGLAFFDGDTIPNGKFHFQLQNGSQGILTTIRYGLLEDFEGAIFLDYVAGEVDESEQGISAKVRFLNQQKTAPFTLSGAATVSLTNEPFINFVRNDAATFASRDLDKTIPVFTPGGDDGDRGKLLILTFALPIHYQVNRDLAFWLTPIAGYAQRQGLEVAGFNVGTAIPISQEVKLIGEVGANLLGDGNSLVEGQREFRTPWTISGRWLPLSLFGQKVSPNQSDPYLELYLTNRVGSSTWHQLRVRENNNVAIGVGLSVPF